MTPAARRELLAMLARLVPADGAEAADLARIRDLVARSPSPFDRTRLAPGHLTASALVRHPTRPAIALVHHRRLGRWLQPGGHAEPGEQDPLAVALREVREETGLSCHPVGEAPLLDVDVHEIPASAREAAHEHFDLRLLFQADGEELVASGESLGVRWATTVELAALGADPGLARAARKALG